ncbi:DUF6233 domain-containing protein [Streptomyces sp. NPDC057521]|uniref:DUF6233 domain-containing protein n=1 Tax=Streptomyces sp. NPDC057521 TaxID=3346156 RepID=UPI0036A36021
MSEGEGSRLELLRFLERVRVRDLARTREGISQEEQRLAEIASRLPPPPPPHWLVEMGIGQSHRLIAVHQGGCKLTGSRVKPVSAVEARRLIGENGALACGICRPDTELGML